MAERALGARGTIRSALAQGAAAWQAPTDETDAPPEVARAASVSALPSVAVPRPVRPPVEAPRRSADTPLATAPHEAPAGELRPEAPATAIASPALPPHEPAVREPLRAPLSAPVGTSTDRAPQAPRWPSPIVDVPPTPSAHHEYEPEASSPATAALRHASPIASPLRALPGATRSEPLRSTERRESPAEVHVSIGRVELTVLPAQAAPRSPAPRRAATGQSLADYLRRGSESRR